MKAFKYFDLNNNGTVEPEEFAKAIEKIGIMIPTKQVSVPNLNISHTFPSSRPILRHSCLDMKDTNFNFILQDLDALFSLYDRDRSGALDYKEFSFAIYNKEVGGSPVKGGSAS